MKIVNKRKFVKSVSITIVILSFLILILLSNISFSHTEAKYKEISISSGDTLWSIAKFEQINNLYFEDKEVRDIIFEIKELNNLKDGNINIGDKLNIPTI